MKVTAVAGNCCKSDYTGGYDVGAVGFRDQKKEALRVWVVNRAAQPMPNDLDYEPLKGQEVSVWHYYIAGKAVVDPDNFDLEPVRKLEPQPTKGQVSSVGRLVLNLLPPHRSLFSARRPLGRRR